MPDARELGAVFLGGGLSRHEPEGPARQPGAGRAIADTTLHIELRQFPHTARAFNLSEAEVRARIVGPWTAGHEVEWAEHRFSPRKARLTILRSAALRPDQLGIGRGWQEAQRTGEDVTAALLAEPEGRHGPLAELKQALRERGMAAGSLPLSAAVSVAAERWPGRRVSEQLTLAEQAVWELLQAGQLRLYGADGAEVEPDAWRARLTDWRSWSAATTTLRAPAAD